MCKINNCNNCSACNSDVKTTRDYDNLYSITGDIKDVNTVLINRQELAELLKQAPQPKEDVIYINRSYIEP